MLLFFFLVFLILLFLFLVFLLLFLDVLVLFYSFWVWPWRNFFINNLHILWFQIALDLSIITTRYFWPLVPSFYLWKRDWVLSSASYHFCDFPNISYFPKILSLKLLGNLWGKLYTIFFVLDTKYHLTYGESNLY